MDLQRRQSGRDLKKAEKQRLSLGTPGSTIHEKQSYNLVVCGATNPEKDGWLFANFMGMCMALREHGVAGDFFSCFPVEDHFTWLRDKNTPAIDVIKFGEYGDNKEKALYTYSRHSFVKREYWWTPVEKDELLGKVKEWIHEKHRMAKAGDVINIILEGHGTKNGEYRMGENGIHPCVFRDLLSGFAEGVQVNAIAGACHSGAFTDAIKTREQKNRYFAMACNKGQLAYSTTRSVSNRIRNGRFTHAFVQSLARVSLPGSARRNVSWKVTDHEGFMKTQLMRNLTPGAVIIEPRFYATQPIDGMTLVEELIFRDKVDIAYDPRVAARRRRIEWPTADENIRNEISSGAPMSPSPPAQAKALLETEVAQCDTRRGLPIDLGVYDELYTNDPNWNELFRNLYWRARRQSAVWDTFELLANRGFLDPACLATPVALLGSSDNVWYVSVVLGCFSLPHSDQEAAFAGQIPAQPCEWDTDLEWLSTMIVRSGAEIPRLLETIHTSRFLGEFLHEAFARIKETYPGQIVTQNPSEKAGRLLPDGTVPPAENVFGFWLPHGISNKSEEEFAQQIRKCKARFNDIEKAFREVAAIPKELLWLEEEQVEFFDAYPDLLPGAKNDFPESCVVYEFPPSI